MPLHWKIEDITYAKGDGWLAIDKTQGTINTGTDQVSITPLRDGLPRGFYSATISFKSINAKTAPKQVKVIMGVRNKGRK
jgi:hypothetical protein